MFQKFRMHKHVFNQLHQKYRDDFEKCDDVRPPINGKKRLAILLHWLQQFLFLLRGENNGRHGFELQCRKDLILYQAEDVVL